MLILNKAAVAQSLSHTDCIEVLAAAMKSVSRRDVAMPLRQFISIPDTRGKFTAMPGYLHDPRCFGIKLVSKYPREPDSPHGSHVGAVMVFDAEQGIPVALLDGAELTAIRTSAASALATGVLARDNAEVLTVLGCGDEARHHIQALLAVRPLREIIVWGRSAERARRFVEQCLMLNSIPDSVTIGVAPDAETAVAAADIICTVTSATEPIISGDWVTPGTHINLVGAAVRTAAEADQQLVCNSRFYIDYRESAMAQAGELLNAIASGAIDEGHIVGEIGDVLLGNCQGRCSEQEITVYKSLGVSAQDLAAAVCAVDKAKRQGIGISIDW